MTTKKLLYIINHIDWFWSHRLPLAQGAQQDGWDVCVAVTGGAQNARLTEHHFTGLELPASDRGFMPFRILKIMWRIWTILQQEKPDLVHAITLKYAFLAGLPARFCKDIRIVFTIAGLGYLFSGEGLKPAVLRILVGPFLKLALKHPRAHIIFQNPDDMALMIQRGFATRDNSTLILGSGVDLRHFPFAQEPDHTTAPLVLMPTRLVRDKGLAVFVEAAKIVHTRGISARFEIAGSLTHNNPLALTEQDMHTLLDNSPVIWLGKVDDMPELLARCALVCYPSWYGEGIPKVLLEACATGRAIVTTDHAGCRETVTQGQNGLLVPVKDPYATAEAMITLLQNPALRRDMGKKSRARAERDFDVRLITRNTLDVYHTVLKERCAYSEGNTRS